MPAGIAEGAPAIDAGSQGVEFGGGFGTVDPGGPVAAETKGPVLRGRKPGWRGLGHAIVEAAPFPVLGAFDEIGAQRVALDVSGDREKVFVVLDRERFVPSLVEGAGAGGVAVGVPAAHVCDGEPLHECGH